MSRVKDGPTIHVRPETRKELGRVKNDLELKSLDEAIKSLLARPDFTQEELLQLRKLIWGGYEPSEEDCKNIQSAEMKISELIYKNELTECLDDRCKSGRKAGGELRNKLLEDTGLPEAQHVHSKCTVVDFIDACREVKK